MFEVTSFSECPKTGITSFAIKWSLNNGVKNDQGSFLCSEDARNYINSSKRSYVLLLFDDFVYRAGVNFEMAVSDYYQNENRVKALERCRKYAQWFEEKEIAVIARVILALQEDLRRILPKPSDATFSALESKIVDLVIFCKAETAGSAVKQTP